MATDATSSGPSALTSPDRLQKIDQLREKNVGKHLPLPQLVVAGDQSSGKSSLLETLTGIPFPHGQELCTRYATQITHRRDEIEIINITIIPGPQASPADKIRLEAYRKSVHSTSELYSQFETILAEVNVHMGIKTAQNVDGEKTFSQDVLKIEKCGPTEDYLTVIDVPGIFRTTLPGVTTERDKELVKTMVRDYIRDDRTVILAILPSNVDITTQEILELAEEYDKTGERTLGVLTKPDLLLERTLKASVCSLIKGTRKPLTLGYYLVRNRGGDDDGLDDSTTERREDLFHEEPWCTLPKDRVGVMALRERLQDLLGQITDRAFPKLRNETRQALAETQKSLDDLGLSRETEPEQQQYLTRIASSFQAMTRAALDADYSAHPALSRDELRLITSVINITDDFNSEFTLSSHTRRFQAMEKEAVPSESSPDDSDTNGGNTSDDDEDADDSSTTSEDYALPDTDPAAFPELEGIVAIDHTGEEPSEDVMQWIDNIYRRSRGADLGNFSPGLLSSAFREQSRKWPAMATSYISKIIVIIHKFILLSLGEICSDARVREELISTLLEDLLRRYEAGMEQAMFLVHVERDMKPYTLIPSFSTHLQKSRSSRLTGSFRAMDAEQAIDVGNKRLVDLDSIQLAINGKDTTDYVKEGMHDILEAYYKIARGRFVDNLYQQAVTHYLLSGSKSPLRLFSEQWVLGLDSYKLAAIAKESRSTTERRERLKKKIHDLEIAMEILQ